MLEWTLTLPAGVGIPATLSRSALTEDRVKAMPDETYRGEIRQIA